MPTYRLNKHRLQLVVVQLVAFILLTAVEGAVAAPARSHLTVSIQASPQLISSHVALAAIDDTRELLQQAMPYARVSINSTSRAQIAIILPDTNIRSSYWLASATV
jgi:hypothetical protein